MLPQSSCAIAGQKVQLSDFPSTKEPLPSWLWFKLSTSLIKNSTAKYKQHFTPRFHSEILRAKRWLVRRSWGRAGDHNRDRISGVRFDRDIPF
jgi:hypothetical protein